MTTVYIVAKCVDKLCRYFTLKFLVLISYYNYYSNKGGNFVYHNWNKFKMLSRNKSWKYKDNKQYIWYLVTKKLTTCSPEHWNSVSKNSLVPVPRVYSNVQPKWSIIVWVKIEQTMSSIPKHTHPSNKA